MLLGDSNVHRIRPHISDKPGRVKVLSKSGATLEECGKQACAELRLSNSNQRIKVVVHAGTNDVPKLKCPELLDKYRKLIRDLKEIRNDCEITICSLPDRLDKGLTALSRVQCVNESLINICREEGATVLPIHQHLHSKSVTLHRDGVHYNDIGAKIVASAVNASLHHFLKDAKEKRIAT